MTDHSRAALQDDERRLEAARWYVRHESGDELPSHEWREWEAWAANPANSTKYDEYVRLHQRVVTLARPSLPSDVEIRTDAFLPRTARWSFWSAKNRERLHWASQRGATALLGGLLFLAPLSGTFLFGDRAAKPPAVTIGSEDRGEGLPFDESTLGRLRAAGRPVFVNLRASWCPTCTVNERTVLARDSVQQMMTRKRVAYLTGDWSLQDPTISAVLHRFGRGGVPLYLLFSPGSSEPRIFPQVLTEHVVLRELAGLPDPSATSL